MTAANGRAEWGNYDRFLFPCRTLGPTDRKSMYATLEMTSASNLPENAPGTDEELFLRFRDTDDRSLFEQLVHRYERELFSYLRRYLGDQELAADTFQVTFLQVFLKREQFEQGRKFRPWLYAIATNQAIDVQRRNKRHRVASLDQRHSHDDSDVGKLVDLLVSGTPDPLTDVTREERQGVVRGAVEQLPELLRVVVNLVYYQGMKYRDAADVLGVPVGTVKSRLHAALVKMGEYLKQRDAD